MSRLPVIAFATLVAATAAAFFITQHLKVTAPLVAGFPAPFPDVINPVSGRTCTVTAPDRKRVRVSYRRTKVSFYLQHRADDVDVWVTGADGVKVRGLATDRHMGIKHRVAFVWNGREDDGRFAPDGSYYFWVALVHQGRTVEISNASGPEPVKIKTNPPVPVVTSVTPQLVSPDPNAKVAIHYAGTENRAITIELYRTDPPGKPRLVKQFTTPFNTHSAIWDGLIDHRPAPAGTYLVGISMTDAACNLGTFPKRIPPARGSTPHAGVTIEYLTAEPPLEPVAAGSNASVVVYSARTSYQWSLARAGARKPVATGTGASPAISHTSALRVPLPQTRAALYALTLSSGPYRTTVPLEAHATRPARVLVVLPALTWQGLDPVDDTGDGLPDTLAGDQPITLARPLVDGLPAGFADEWGLLSYLSSSHHAYDLTTDLGLFFGTGPTLAGHSLVILAGSEQWLPGAVAAALRGYVKKGGHVLSLGAGSLLRTVTIAGGKALDPSPPSTTDVLGARPGALVSHNSQPIAVISDALGIFPAGSLGGFASYQPIQSVAAPARVVSEAGVSSSAPSIVGYRLGRGVVVDVGLSGFGSRLAGDAAARKLVGRLWTVLAG